MITKRHLLRKLYRRRNWWGLKCWLRWCGGRVDYDDRSVHWMCEDCGKVTRDVTNANKRT